MLAGVTTPAEVLVEAGKPVKFTLTMPGKVPATIDTFTPSRGADGVVKHGKLVDGTLVNVTSNLEGKVSVGQLVHCQSLELPAQCMAPPGNYFLDVTIVAQNAAGGRVTRKITVANKPKSEAVEFGYVEPPPGKTLQVGAAGPAVKRAVLEVGNRKVTISGGEEPPKTVTVNVKAGATVVAN